MNSSAYESVPPKGTHSAMLQTPTSADKAVLMLTPTERTSRRDDEGRSKGAGRKHVLRVAGTRSCTCSGTNVCSNNCTNVCSNNCTNVCSNVCSNNCSSADNGADSKTADLSLSTTSTSSSSISSSRTTGRKSVLDRYRPASVSGSPVGRDALDLLPPAFRSILAAQSSWKHPSNNLQPSKLPSRSLSVTGTSSSTAAQRCSRRQSFSMPSSSSSFVSASDLASSSPPVQNLSNATGEHNSNRHSNQHSNKSSSALFEPTSANANTTHCNTSTRLSISSRSRQRIKHRWPPKTAKSPPCTSSPRNDPVLTVARSSRTLQSLREALRLANLTDNTDSLSSSSSPALPWLQPPLTAPPSSRSRTVSNTAIDSHSGSRATHSKSTQNIDRVGRNYTDGVVRERRNSFLSAQTPAAPSDSQSPAHARSQTHRQTVPQHTSSEDVSLPNTSDSVNSTSNSCKRTSISVAQLCLPSADQTHHASCSTNMSSISMDDSCAMLAVGDDDDCNNNSNNSDKAQLLQHTAEPESYDPASLTYDPDTVGPFYDDFRDLQLPRGQRLPKGSAKMYARRRKNYRFRYDGPTLLTLEEVDMDGRRLLVPVYDRFDSGSSSRLLGPGCLPKRRPSNERSDTAPGRPRRHRYSDSSDEDDDCSYTSSYSGDSDCSISDDEDDMSRFPPRRYPIPPSHRPEVWVTKIVPTDSTKEDSSDNGSDSDNDSTVDVPSRGWKVKRVWNIEEMDACENEMIANDVDELRSTVDHLLGVDRRSRDGSGTCTRDDNGNSDVMVWRVATLIDVNGQVLRGQSVRENVMDEQGVMNCMASMAFRDLSSPDEEAGCRRATDERSLQMSAPRRDDDTAMTAGVSAVRNGSAVASESHGARAYSRPDLWASPSDERGRRLRRSWRSKASASAPSDGRRVGSVKDRRYTPHLVPSKRETKNDRKMWWE